MNLKFQRYFTKVFTQQKKEEVPTDEEKKENSGTEATSGELVEGKKTTGELVPVSGSSSAGQLQHGGAHPPVIPPSRPIYNSKLAAMKRRAATKDGLAKMAEVQKMKTELYAKLVEQQKALLKKLQQTEDSAQKKKIVNYLKTFEEKVKGVKTELEELAGKMREMQMSSKKPRMAALAAARGVQQAANGKAVTTEGNGGEWERDGTRGNWGKTLN